MIDFETQSWMCKNAQFKEFVYYDERLRKLHEDWSIFDGVLHHDTCPKIDGDKIKGSWSFPTIVSNCSCCGVEIPEGVLMIAKLQLLKPSAERLRLNVKSLQFAMAYGGDWKTIRGLLDHSSKR